MLAVSGSVTVSDSWTKNTSSSSSGTYTGSVSGSWQSSNSSQSSSTLNSTAVVAVGLWSYASYDLTSGNTQNGSSQSSSTDSQGNSNSSSSSWSSDQQSHTTGSGLIGSITSTFTTSYSSTSNGQTMSGGGTSTTTSSTALASMGMMMMPWGTSSTVALPATLAAMPAGGVGMAAAMATPSYSSFVVSYLQSIPLVQPPPPPPAPPAPQSLSDQIVSGWNSVTSSAGDALNWLGGQVSNVVSAGQSAVSSAVTFVTSIPSTISSAADSLWSNYLAPWIVSWDSVLGNPRTGWFAQVSNFSAGMGDTISCGLTSRVRRGLGYDDVVDYNGPAYRYGTYAGEAVNIGLTVANPAGAARWAVNGVRLLNNASRVGSAIGAAEAALNGNPTQAGLMVLGAFGAGARGAGSACTVTNVLQRTALRASQAAGFIQGAAGAVDRFRNGDVIGGVLSLAQMGASAYRLSQSCFTADMLLETESGKRRADTIQVGDRLWSRNEFVPDGPLVLQEVEEVFVRVAPILNVHVGGGILRTTGEHMFWVQGRGWVPAWDLKIGDQFRKMNDELAPIDGIAESGLIETVYNWRVAEFHTYFVGCKNWDFSVWSHNTDPCTVTGRIPNNQLKPPARRGNAPIGSDGHPVELHHTDQTLGNASPRVEMTRTDHRGPGNFGNNHTNTGQQPSTVDRRESRAQHRAHWEAEWDAGRFVGM